MAEGGQGQAKGLVDENLACGVLFMWSSPRTTWVTPMAASSTTTARL